MSALAVSRLAVRLAGLEAELQSLRTGMEAASTDLLQAKQVGPVSACSCACATDGDCVLHALEWGRC
jgi:hypothetical protein